MFLLELGVFMFRYSKSELPTVFNDYFTKRSDIHCYQTRHVNDLNLTHNKKAFSDHSIRTGGPLLWNSLEEHKEHRSPSNISLNKSLSQIINNYFRAPSFVSCLLVIVKILA